MSRPPHPQIPPSWTALHQRGQLLGLSPALLQRALERETGRPLSPVQVSRLSALMEQRCGLDSTPGPLDQEREVHLPHPEPGSTGEFLLDLLAHLDSGTGKRGQVFTPWAVARRLVELLQVGPHLRCLDPAAGAGILLQAAVASGARADTCQALEPDPLLHFMGRVLMPKCAWKEGDALAPWEELPKGWRGGFQRVILNPPYRNGVEARDPHWVAWRNHLRLRFSTARRAFDLYIPFVERALDFLTPSGRLGLLLPMAWLASDGGRPLRLLLARHHRLIHLQHAPGVRLFPRADLDAMLLVVEAHCSREAGEAALIVERLGRDLQVVSGHAWSQDSVRDLAGEGWGPLLWPPEGIQLGRASTLGERHEISASLSAGEYYQLPVQEGEGPGAEGLRLYSSGAIEPFHSTWATRDVRFRKQGLTRPWVRLKDLPASRRRQTEQPRVLIANLSRRLEALAVEPGLALGVVNVIQVLCPDMSQAHALAAWLNSSPMQRWTHQWLDPLRLHTQLALTRQVVSRLPGPPHGHADMEQLAHLGHSLAALWQEGQGGTPLCTRLQEQVDALVARHLP